MSAVASHQRGINIVLASGLTAMTLAACGSSHHDAGPPGITVPGTPTPSVSPSSTGSPTSGPVTLWPKGQSPTSTVTIPTGNNGRCPAAPTPACTGAPGGSYLKRRALNLDGDSYRVTKAGTVLDHMWIPGNLLITANNVTVRNSQIDGRVESDYKNQEYSFTITDSTVGSPTKCDSLPAIGEASYKASGLYIRNHADGFRVSGSNVEIRDSFVKLCSNGNDHSDGIQAYGFSQAHHVIFDHNTVDQRGVSDFTAPINLRDSSGGTLVDVTVTNNLIMGGTYSLQVKQAAGQVIVRGNQVVDKSWSYGPAESECSVINWSGNSLVDIDSGYQVTKTVGPLSCTG